MHGTETKLIPLNIQKNTRVLPFLNLWTNEIPITEGQQEQWDRPQLLLVVAVLKHKIAEAGLMSAVGSRKLLRFPKCCKVEFWICDAMLYEEIRVSRIAPSHSSHVSCRAFHRQYIQYNNRVLDDPTWMIQLRWMESWFVTDRHLSYASFSALDRWWVFSFSAFFWKKII